MVDGLLVVSGLRELPERLTPELLELCGGTKTNRDELQLLLNELRWQIDTCVGQYEHTTKQRARELATLQASGAERMAALQEEISQQAVDVDLPERALAAAKEALKGLRSEAKWLERRIVTGAYSLDGSHGEGGSSFRGGDGSISGGGSGGSVRFVADSMTTEEEWKEHLLMLREEIHAAQTEDATV